MFEQSKRQTDLSTFILAFHQFINVIFIETTIKKPNNACMAAAFKMVCQRIPTSKLT